MLGQEAEGLAIISGSSRASWPSMAQKTVQDSATWQYVVLLMTRDEGQAQILAKLRSTTIIKTLTLLLAICSEVNRICDYGRETQISYLWRILINGSRDAEIFAIGVISICSPHSYSRSVGFTTAKAYDAQRRGSHPGTWEMRKLEGSPAQARNAATGQPALLVHGCGVLPDTNRSTGPLKSGRRLTPRGSLRSSRHGPSWRAVPPAQAAADREVLRRWGRDYPRDAGPDDGTLTRISARLAEMAQRMLACKGVA